MNSSLSRSPCIILLTGMPVARETTSAISSAPTCVRSSWFGFVAGVRRLGSLRLRLELRQLAVLQLGNLVELAFALQLRDVGLDAIDLFLDVRGALHRRLLGLPDLLEIGILLLEAPDLLLDQLEAALGRFVLLLADGLALDLELDQPAVEPVHRLGLRIDLHLDPRGGLVDQVDRLVGQEAVGDVAMAELGRRDDRRVGDLDAVMQLVLLLQAAQDGDRRSRPTARRRAPSGSGARARRPSRRTCGIRRAWSRRCNAARRARARASACCRRRSRPRPCRRRPSCGSRR